MRRRRSWRDEKKVLWSRSSCSSPSVTSRIPIVLFSVMLSLKLIPRTSSKPIQTRIYDGKSRHGYGLKVSKVILIYSQEWKVSDG